MLVEVYVAFKFFDFNIFLQINISRNPVLLLCIPALLLFVSARDLLPYMNGRPDPLKSLKRIQNSK